MLKPTDQQTTDQRTADRTDPQAAGMPGSASNCRAGAKFISCETASAQHCYNGSFASFQACFPRRPRNCAPAQASAAIRAGVGFSRKPPISEPASVAGGCDPVSIFMLEEP